MVEIFRRPWVRHALRIAGWLFLLAALVYFIKALADLGIDRLFGQLTIWDWWIVGFCAVTYGISLTILANSWALLAAPDQKVPLRDAIAVYGTAVIAKYLPGSVFQYASRQMLGANRGWAQLNMAKSSGVEAVLHIAAALTVGMVAFFSQQSPIFLLLLIALGILAGRLVRNKMVRCAASQLVFFAIFGLLLWLLSDRILGINEPMRLSAFFFLAWIAGFLVPVAPGGIGVREAVLLAIAGPLYGGAAVATFALVTRLVNLVGDGLFGVGGYGVSLLFREKRHASE